MSLKIVEYQMNQMDKTGNKMEKLLGEIDKAIFYGNIEKLESLRSEIIELRKEWREK